MPYNVLLIGFEDCEHCKRAQHLLQSKEFKVTTAWTSRDRRTPSSGKIETWKGDYIFHLKSYCILPKTVLDSAAHGAINFHPSPPRYPGSGGINWGLYNKDTTSGVTVHYMNQKIDNGDIISFHPVPVFVDDDVESLLTRVHIEQYNAFESVVNAICEHGPRYLKDKSNIYSGEPWGPKLGRIKDIDSLQKITADIGKEELDRRIRATAFGKFGPNLVIHGKTFKYTGEET